MQRISRILSLAGALLALTIPLILWNVSPRTAVHKPIPFDDLITEVGRYSIDENHFLDIERREPNEIVIRVFAQPKVGFFKSEPYWTFHTGTRFKEEWYIAVDQYNRIWIYVGASTLGREVPSVYLDGYSFNTNGKLCRMTEEVSRTGRWDGVPQILLSRIHASPHAFSGTVPHSSPPLPEHQQILLAMTTEKRR